ncbi:thiamine pyrophosphate-dependent enzyme, partial [Pseudactinotalea suaedae]
GYDPTSDATGIPVADTQAGKGAIAWDHPASVGGLGSTGASSANALAAEADLVIGVGTRYTDFTTASHTAFGPDARFVNVNVSAFDAVKHGAEMVVADARATLEALVPALVGYAVDPSYTREIAELRGQAQRVVDECYAVVHEPLPAQTAVLGVLNEVVTADDVLINAAGSAPGDLQQLFRASAAGQYHLEYGYSCMGYEIPAAMGVKLARPEAEVYALVGDGGYQMAPQELATLVSEGIKVIVVLVQNHGFASIGSLSESRGSERFGTAYRTRNPATGMLDGGADPVDLAANAASFGADVLTPSGLEELRAALGKARASDRTTVVVIETDLQGPNPPGTAWWDVPVSEVSTLPSTQRARSDYERDRSNQRYYL